MTNEYIEIDLSNGEKEAILEHASFFVTDDITKADLSDKRKKWKNGSGLNPTPSHK